VSLFNKLFHSNKLEQPVDMSMISTDMHSHLIPGIDDGSKSIEESLELVKALYNIGYRKLVTTPHIYTEIFKNTPDIILQGLEKLKVALHEANIPVKIEAAAEYMYDDTLTKKFKAGELLSFGKKYVLIELSSFITPVNLFQLLFDMKIDGYLPILAHPERYAYWHDDFENYINLKDREILFQVNLPSLSGYYSPQVRMMAEKLIENNMVEFVGTDIHNMEYFEQIEKSRYSKYLEKLINSGNLLNPTL